MTIVVRNSLTHKIEKFQPLEKGKVTMYTCGPTVYGTPHIGNYRTFFMADIIRRYFEFKGFNVLHVMNITDIDDKTIRDSAKEGLTLKEFTEKYTKVFFEGIDWLHIKRAHIYPRATEHIQDMIAWIQKLVEKGFAYETEDGVYFAIQKFDKYGQLVTLKLEDQKVGERAKADEYDKEHVQDFALWKKSTEEEIKRGIYYESPWGKGRPGWHIECSVMSMKYLGETFDIHTGAVDLKFPHHTNEIAQAEAVTGKPFVRYWIHGEFLSIKEEKMSKSLGNVTTLHQLMKLYDADTIRYLYLSTRYDALLIFSEDKLVSAKNSTERLRNTLENAQTALRELTITSTFGTREQDLLAKASRSRQEFEKVMDNNFDTPKGLKVIHTLAKAINKYLEGEINTGVLLEAVTTYKALLRAFGLFEKVATKEGAMLESKLTDELLQLLIEIRNDARKRKDFQTSDKIRDKLAQLNILLEDTTKGTVWKVKEEKA